ncbi:hypothetical protein A0J61_10190 [Choanephora cucurbitarum]|uniref:Uncharacterized protein n=1 Tax=Choanephora cucurbitarum TaxID=101091 RepID=A0A1C7MY49_9FUNG|nr:hypothetical protein A0J61_10190 [Choanephora cucurbitarum]
MTPSEYVKGEVSLIPSLLSLKHKISSMTHRKTIGLKDVCERPDHLNFKKGYKHEKSIHNCLSQYNKGKYSTCAEKTVSNNVF